MKSLVILRGVSGSGKTTLAETMFPDAIICCADDWFIEDGKYNFIPTELGAAHAHCQYQCEDAMAMGVSQVVIANTNTDPKHFKVYEELAEEYGYQVFHLVVENRHGGRDVHEVPEKSLQKQESVLRKNIQLR